MGTNCEIQPIILESLPTPFIQLPRETPSFIELATTASFAHLITGQPGAHPTSDPQVPCIRWRPLADMSSGTYTRAMHSTDHGNSWTQIAVEPRGYHALALSDTNFFIGNAASLFRSTDYGTTWKMVLDNRNIEYLAADGPNIFAGSRPISGWWTDGGESWVNVKTDFQDDFYMIAISGSNVFLSTPTSGLLLLSRDLTRWINVNDGLLPSDFVTSCGFIGNDVVAGTSHSGVWRRPLSEMIEPREQNLVKNPGFESGKEPWQMYTDGSGEFSTDALGARQPTLGRNPY